jgi:hypothetical protein
MFVTSREKFIPFSANIKQKAMSGVTNNSFQLVKERKIIA